MVTGGVRIQIVGVDPATYVTGRSRPVERADREADLRILLCHYPEAVRMPPPDVFHLVLAGHYHGGQIRLPTPWGRVPLKEFHAPYLHGLYETPVALLHVSRGLGTSFVPVRFLARPEATLLRCAHERDRGQPGGAHRAPRRLHVRGSAFPSQPLSVPCGHSRRDRDRGPVAQPRFHLAALERFGFAEHDVVLECAGHRRAELKPPAGVPWKEGAVSQGRWGGAPLAALLAEARPDAGRDEVVLLGDETFARSIPLAKALHEATLLAWKLDCGPVPHELAFRCARSFPATTRSIR